MALYIEIADDPIISGRSGISQKGTPYTIPDKQRGYVHQGAKYPLQTEIPIPDGKGPYRPGIYLLGEGSFRNGERSVALDDRAMKLEPIEDALASLNKLRAKA